MDLIINPNNNHPGQSKYNLLDAPIERGAETPLKTGDDDDDERKSLTCSLVPGH